MEQEKTFHYAVNKSGRVPVLDVNGLSTIGIQVAGTWDGTLSVQASLDGQNWVDCVDVVGVTLSDLSNGIYRIEVSGIKFIRILPNDWVSGSAEISALAVVGASSSRFGNFDGLGNQQIVDVTEEQTEVVSDTSTGDSDKVFPVPVGEKWLINWIFVDYTNSGSAGSRALEVNILNSSDELLLKARTRATIDGSSTHAYQTFAPGCQSPSNDFVQSCRSDALPEYLVVDEGQKIQVKDANAVAVAADNMLVKMSVTKIQ